MMTLLKLRRGSYSLVSETLPDGARAVGLSIQELPLPRSSVICAILRGSDVVIPRGDVRLRGGRRRAGAGRRGVGAGAGGALRRAGAAATRP